VSLGPWHADQVEACEWGGVAEFRHALVTHFGVGRVWLAGEAAHLTGPLGVQSCDDAGSNAGWL